jgi:hypothetical protein
VAVTTAPPSLPEPSWPPAPSPTERMVPVTLSPAAPSVRRRAGRRSSGAAGWDEQADVHRGLRM